MGYKKIPGRTKLGKTPVGKTPKKVRPAIKVCCADREHH
jgi:hypothetical protein